MKYVKLIYIFYILYKEHILIKLQNEEKVIFKNLTRNEKYNKKISKCGTQRGSNVIIHSHSPNYPI